MASVVSSVGYTSHLATFLYLCLKGRLGTPSVSPLRMLIIYKRKRKTASVQTVPLWKYRYLHTQCFTNDLHGHTSIFISILSAENKAWHLQLINYCCWMNNERMNKWNILNTKIYWYPAAARCDYVFTYHFISSFSKHRGRRMNKTYLFL